MPFEFKADRLCGAASVEAPKRKQSAFLRGTWAAEVEFEFLRAQMRSYSRDSTRGLQETKTMRTGLLSVVLGKRTRG